MKVIVGIGVPGSGKTTYLKPLAERLNMAYINPDDIREEITGDATDHSQEVLVWATVHERTVTATKATGVVVDATYTKRRDRRELITLCKIHGVHEIIAYWFNVPLAICMQRNAQRHRKVPEKVLQKMHHKLKLNPPMLQEGFSEIIEIKS